MKKKFLIICLLFSVFTVAVYAEEKIDRSLWWSSTADDPGLRRKFEELNRKYFSGTLKVKYIRYGHGLWKQDKLMSLTYYWGVNAVADYAGCSVITIDDEYFVSHPDELESSLLTDMCRVYANMNDRNGNNDNVSTDELPSFKLMMDYLTKVGAKPWLSHKSVSVDSSINNNTNQTSTKQSSQIAQAPQQNQTQKSFTSTQTSRTSSQTTSLSSPQITQTTTKSSSPTTNSTETIDKLSWWKSREEDSYLRKRFEELNKKYFNGELKVKYIRYGHGLIDDNFTAITYYWNSTANAEHAYQSIITVDDRFFVQYPEELDGALLHEMCHVYANMHDADAEIPGIDGHQLPSYKKMMKHLIEIGANPRTGEGIVNIE